MRAYRWRRRQIDPVCLSHFATPVLIELVEMKTLENPQAAQTTPNPELTHGGAGTRAPSA